MIAVTPNDAVQSLCLNQSWIEPHAPFLEGGESAMLQIIEKGRYLLFKFQQEISIITFKRTDFTYPITVFARVNNDRVEFVVGTENELGKEIDFLSVLTLCLHLVGLSRAEILQAFRILPATQQHFIHNDEQLASPVCIELAPEILIRIKSGIVLKDGFKEIQESCLAW